jgi:hypothetical protein
MSCRVSYERIYECPPRCMFCGEDYKENDALTFYARGHWNRGRVRGLHSVLAHRECMRRFWDGTLPGTPAPLLGFEEECYESG